MENFISYVVKNLVKDNESVKVVKSETETEITYEIFVNADDKGKIIGRNGKIINSLKTIVRSFVGKSAKRINLKIGE